MSQGNIAQDNELDICEVECQEEVAEDIEKEIGSEEHAKTRQRIDMLLEKKRLKGLLDEDEWEL